MVQQAEWIAGLKLAEADRKTLAGALTRSLRDFETMQAVKLPNSVPPVLAFNPAPWLAPEPRGPPRHRRGDHAHRSEEARRGR